MQRLVWQALDLHLGDAVAAQELDSHNRADTLVGVIAVQALDDSILGFTEPEWKGRIGFPPTNASFQAFVAAIRDATGRALTRVPVRPEDVVGPSMSRRT